MFESSTELRALPQTTWWHRLNSNFQGDLLYFLSYPLLPVILLIVLGLVSGSLGEGVGTRYLIFHADPVKELIVGFFLGVLATECLLIGFLLRLKHRQTTSFHTLPNFYLYSFNILFGLAIIGVGLFLLNQLAILITGVPPFQIDAISSPDPDINRLPLMFGLGVGYCLQALTISLAPFFGKFLADAFLNMLGYLLKVLRSPVGSVCCGGLLLAAAGTTCLTLMQGQYAYLGWILAGLIMVLLAFPGTRQELGETRDFSKILLFFGTLAFVGLTWLSSHFSYRMAVPGSFLLLTLLTAALYGAFPIAFQEHVSRIEKRILREVTDGKVFEDEESDRNYLSYYIAAALVVPLFGIIFVAFSLTPAWTSPVPTFCYFMYIVVSGYGLLRFVSRRTIPIAMAVLGMLLALGGVPAYKQRFDQSESLGYFYKSGRMLDIAESLEADHKNQQIVDQLIRSHHPDRARLIRDLDNQQLIVPLRDMRPNHPMLGLADFQDSDEETRFRRLLAVQDVQFNPPNSGKKRPLVLICMSGGGLRAAAWTFAMLHQLEVEFAAQGIDFPAHVRIISGASGGMLGAAAYVSSLPPPNQRAEWRERDEELINQYQQLTADCLTPLVNQMVFGDLPALFSPWPQHYDRGKALERSWIDNGLKSLNKTFGELRQGEIEGWRPSLIFSPMMIEDGRRLLISNLDLRYVASNDGSLIQPDNLSDPNRPPNGFENYSKEAMELFRMFPSAKRDFTLASAVRMSATFPFFTPAVSLPTRPRRRVVDAGYYDNYGVSIASAWLFSNKNKAWLDNNVSKIVIIQIRAWPSEESRTLKRLELTGSSPLSRSIEELMSVPEAMDGARVSSASFRNDGQLELMSAIYSARRETKESHRELMKNAPGPIMEVPASIQSEFTVVNFEPRSGGVLSWYLSADEIAEIKAEARNPDNLERIRKLIDWWGKEPK
ncbi:patatin-like phospholipase family protein [Telmatocola sphagniphila]|uniref:Patatin-like phospholipase family protein n=1 Tax=Telmatocola sphagniphila TaxID=1123043 RepID=A0A8E6B796_9BACT|nr:patatin-like phospholipase family protein [Telmatocola sphagniphila]QVL31848.1 patatin-like phospholipase family protein [Telmatocola sphagniphila]